MLAIDDEGATFTDSELVAITTLLVSAGHETTTSLIALATLTLLRNRPVLDMLLKDASRIPDAVDELLRYDGPIQMLARTPKEEVTIGGTTIPKGHRVMLMIGSANRDPAQFPSPDEVNLARPRGVQIGFGFGPHFCPGAQLARVETQLALGHLITRFPRAALATERLEWNKSLSIRGLTHLPVIAS
jgi:cytochrome P450